jgi:hypothetical protein
MKFDSCQGAALRIGIYAKHILINNTEVNLYLKYDKTQSVAG